ncbi:MAG: methyl-accepting chemotaxis protein [Syntrophomonas sp.]
MAKKSIKSTIQDDPERTPFLSEIEVVCKAIKAGRLATRADLERVAGQERTILENVNEMLDAILQPMQAASTSVYEISQGKIPARLKGAYPGDLEAVKTNINACIDGLTGLNECCRVLSRLAVNDHTQIAPVDYPGIFGEAAAATNEVRERLLSIADMNHSIAAGDLHLEELVSIGKRSEEDEMVPSYITMVENIERMLDDAHQLEKAAVEGRLDYRIDVSLHNGKFRDVLEGVNNTLDAVIQPIAEAAQVLIEMEKGNLGVMVRGDYKGNHAMIKNALNNTIESLKSYVGEIDRVLSEMARGNLDLQISQNFRGDFCAIRESLQCILSSFNETLRDINTASEQVSDGSVQVARSSQALAQGAAEQSSSVEELTSSITQIAAQTSQNAANAAQANELAESARTNADEGNNQMKHMVEAMEAINESSNNISKIIKVIDEIAFQTNILALNAAVEAARAGQHGKGFAVVAEEVRNLAARSASAARETTEMIEGSIKKTEAGTRIAHETALALGQIVESVSWVASLVGDIADASSEQAVGIAQIDQGLEQISQVVQANAATAEESAAASEELSSQADLLKTRVGKFNLQSQAQSQYGIDLAPDVIAILQELAQKPDLLQVLGMMGLERSSERASKIDYRSPGPASLSDQDFGKY